MALTEKQKRFADYYLETGNGAEAARRAGYKEKNADNMASENLRKPAIMKYIEERRRQMDEKRIATVDEVLLFFSQVMRGEVKDQFGLDSQLSDRINAGKELMKRFKDIGATEEAEQENDGFIEALNDSAEEDWADESQE
ncbi:MAG: terminase small subunit [Lachnospiraceae bacterium]|nr:terminase small subunit [Lachnospiraceae bacterium]